MNKDRRHNLTVTIIDVIPKITFNFIPFPFSKFFFFNKFLTERALANNHIKENI